MVGKVNPRRFNIPNEILKSRRAEKELYHLFLRRATSSVTNAGGALGQTGGGGTGPTLPDTPGKDVDMECFGFKRVKFIDFCFDETTLAGRIDTEPLQKLWRFDARAGTTILFEEDTDDLLSLTKTLGFAFKPWVFDQFVTFNNIVSHLDDLFMFGGDINMVGNKIIDVGGNASGKGAFNGAIRIANHTSKAVSEGRIGFRNFQGTRDYFFYLDVSNRFVYEVNLDFAGGDQTPSQIVLRTTTPTSINEMLLVQNSGQTGPTQLFVPSSFAITVNRGTPTSDTVFEIEAGLHHVNLFDHDIRRVRNIRFKDGFPDGAIIAYIPSSGFITHAVLSPTAGHTFSVGGVNQFARKVTIDQAGLLIRGENGAFLRWSDGSSFFCSAIKQIGLPLEFNCNDGYKFEIKDGGPFIFQSRNNQIGSPPMQVFFRAKNTSNQDLDYAFLLTEITENFPNFEGGSMTLGALASNPFVNSPTPMLKIGGDLLPRVKFLVSGQMSPNTIFDFDKDTFAVFRGSKGFTNFSTDRLLFSDEENAFHLSVITETGIVDLEDPSGSGIGGIDRLTTSKGTQSITNMGDFERLLEFTTIITHNIFNEDNSTGGQPASWYIFAIWEIIIEQSVGGYANGPLFNQGKALEFMDYMQMSITSQSIVHKTGSSGRGAQYRLWVGFEDPDQSNQFRRKPFPVDKAGLSDDFRNWDEFVSREGTLPIGTWGSLTAGGQTELHLTSSSHWIVLAATHSTGAGGNNPHTKMKNGGCSLQMHLSPGVQIRNIPEIEWDDIQKGAYSVDGKGEMWNFTDAFLAV